MASADWHASMSFGSREEGGGRSCGCSLIRLRKASMSRRGFRIPVSECPPGCPASRFSSPIVFNYPLSREQADYSPVGAQPRSASRLTPEYAGFDNRDTLKLAEREKVLVHRDYDRSA